MSKLPSFNFSLKTIAIVCSMVFPNFTLGIDPKMSLLEQKIADIENEYGIFSKDLYFPLVSMANQQIEEKLYADSIATLKRAQSLSHRHKGVLNIDQIDIINKLTKLAIIRADLDANRYQNCLFSAKKRSTGS